MIKKEKDCYLNSDSKNGEQKNGSHPNGVPHCPLKEGYPLEGRGGGTPTRCPK